MQFIAQDPVHVSVRSEDAQFGARGQKVKTLKRKVFAKFQRGIPPWAVPIAAKTFDFSHMPPERSIEQWCGFYDSEADQIQMDWNDEERNAIETELVARGYLLVERPKAPLPYPTYAKHRKTQGKRTVEHVIAEVKATLEATGIDPAAVLAYEADHFDADSQTIMEAFASAEEEESLVAA